MTSLTDAFDEDPSLVDWTPAGIVFSASQRAATALFTLDPATLQIRSMTTRDRQGGDSTLTFTNLQENTGISDKEFVFRIPRGVEVITDGNK